MELKATLKDYTESEFLALVEWIWAVDLPKQEHDRLINQFDRIAGHPKGADLLFYPDDRYNLNSPESVVEHVKDWHHKQGIQAFKNQAAPIPNQPVNMSTVARKLTEVQKIAADVAVLEQAVEIAFGVFEQRIGQSQSQQQIQLGIDGEESSIRALERAQDETSIAVRKYDFCKMRIEFAKNSAQNDLKFARTENAQWQSIVQQINATHDHYIARLANFNQRHRALHDQAETLLVLAQAQLIRSRNLAKVGPAHAAWTIRASLTFADKRPDVLLEGGPSALYLSQRIDLQKAIRSAAAEFAWRNTSGEPSDENQRAAVLSFEFSSRADAQVFAVSVPLVELLPLEGQDWQSLAASRSEVEVPFRMGTAIVPAKPGAMHQGLREVKTLTQVHLRAGRRGSSASRVRVRAVQYDSQLNTWIFTADGTAAISVFWSAPATLETSVPELRPPLYRLGFVYSPPVPTLELIAGEEEMGRFDDYIVVFPVDSGRDPLYVMFRNRGDYPV